MVVVGSADSFEDIHAKVQVEKLPAVFYYTAVWCGPCRVMAPVIEKMSRQYPKIPVYKFDIDMVTVIWCWLVHVSWGLDSSYGWLGRECWIWACWGVSSTGFWYAYDWICAFSFRVIDGFRFLHPYYTAYSFLEMR